MFLPDFLPFFSLSFQSIYDKVKNSAPAVAVHVGKSESSRTCNTHFITTAGSVPGKEGSAILNIQMVGIDYNQASIEYRELFSLTQSHAFHTAQALKERCGCDGVVVLSTCNRTELWLSGVCREDPLEAFCHIRSVPHAEYSPLFTRRKALQAVEYLFCLACGMQSQIFGEDQILTQVKNALSLAREAHCTDSVLEVLFRSAVTCAKEIKASVALTAKDTSVPARAVRLLKETRGTLEGCRCLVIGNGEMGRLAANCLVREHAEVWMTLRSYKSREVIIPYGVTIIPYEERYEKLREVQIAFSATVSPHYTLNLDDSHWSLPLHPIALVDLAVPRDVDPRLGTLEGVTLLDMDKLGMTSRELQESPALQKAQKLIRERVLEFQNWYGFRSCVPLIHRIGFRTSQEVRYKLVKPLRQNLASSEERALIQELAQAASQKAVCNLLYGLREHLDPSQWQACLQALEKSAMELDS